MSNQSDKTIMLNGEPCPLAEPCALNVALNHWGYACDEIAVAINEEFVPRTQWEKRICQPGDHIEVVAPIQGG